MVLKLTFTLLLAVAGVVSYPQTARDDVSQPFFGTIVRDPYRWLERTQSPEVKQWVASQTALTSRVLDAIRNRDFFSTRISELRAASSPSSPSVGRYATVFVSGSGALTVQRNGKTGILLDPKTRWASSTRLFDWALSPDGLELAYGTETAGNGWVRWHTLSTTTSRDLPGEVIGTPDWAPIFWAADSSGFYYDGYASETHPAAGTPIGTEFRERFHRIGTPQSADRLIYARPDRPTLLPYARPTPDGRYLILATSGDGPADAHAETIEDLRTGRVAARIQPPDSSEYDYIGNAGERFYFLSHFGAPNGKVVRIDLRTPNQPVDVIAESNEILGSAAVVGNRFIAHYFRDAASDLVVFDLSGTMLHRIALPGIGGTTDFSPQTPSLGYYTFSSPTTPPRTYAYDVDTNTSTLYSGSRTAPFGLSDYVTEEFFAPSTGGVRVPVFVAHRRGMKLDGTTPLMLTGYGGFGDDYQPMWQDFGAAWLARGGVFAIACVRGGGEYGEKWHRDGMLGNKQHAFDDFAAAASLLTRKGFASPRTLVAYGYSGGGLLVGVTEVQHPELFAAVAEEAGTVDVLRSYSYGAEAYWATEVGSPVASPAQFRWLYRYAPLVHIQKGRTYPATFVMTSENDSYVSPAHAYKFAATLQWAQAGPRPIVLYVAPHTGHVEAMSSARVLGDTEAFLWAYSS